MFADDKNNMLSVRFVIERSFDKVSEKTSSSELTWFVEVDTYVVVPSSLPFHGLIRHALSSLGYSDLEAISCKGWSAIVVILGSSVASGDVHAAGFIDDDVDAAFVRCKKNKLKTVWV